MNRGAKMERNNPSRRNIRTSEQGRRPMIAQPKSRKTFNVAFTRTDKRGEKIGKVSVAEIA